MRVVLIPNERDFKMSGGNFPVFRALPLRGRGFGGTIAKFFSNLVLPFFKRKVLPRAINAASKTAADILIKKKQPKKVIKKRILEAGKNIGHDLIRNGINRKRKGNASLSANKKRRQDIFG